MDMYSTRAEIGMEMWGRLAGRAHRPWMFQPAPGWINEPESSMLSNINVEILKLNKRGKVYCICIVMVYRLIPHYSHGFYVVDWSASAGLRLQDAYVYFDNPPSRGSVSCSCQD